MTTQVKWSKGSKIRTADNVRILCITHLYILAFISNAMLNTRSETAATGRFEKRKQDVIDVMPCNVVPLALLTPAANKLPAFLALSLHSSHIIPPILPLGRDHGRSPCNVNHPRRNLHARLHRTLQDHKHYRDLRTSSRSVIPGGRGMHTCIVRYGGCHVHAHIQHKSNSLKVDARISNQKVSKVFCAEAHELALNTISIHLCSSLDNII